MSRLVVVSNRVAVPDSKGTAGGLAVALREAFEAYPGLWFGWSGKVSAQPSAQPRIVDKGRVKYALMDLTSIDRQEYYSGFANRALWPTMHYRIGLCGLLARRLCGLSAGQPHLRGRHRPARSPGRLDMGPRLSLDTARGGAPRNRDR